MPYLIALLIVSPLVLAYSIYETKSLRAKKIKIRNSNDFLKGKRIVAFSDVHLGMFTSCAQFKRCVNAINEANGDYVFFIGDFADKFKKDYSELNDFAKNELKRIRAKSGKYAILGNNDTHIIEAEQFTKGCLDGGEFITLINCNVKLGENTYLIGLDHLKYGNPNITEGLNGIDAKSYKILLMHEPDFVIESEKYGIDLQLSGHSHGGQVLLPFLYKIFLPYGGRKYFRGEYRINNTKLIISNGVGVHTIPLRFLAPPDILVIDFK